MVAKSNKFCVIEHAEQGPLSMVIAEALLQSKMRTSK